MANPDQAPPDLQERFRGIKQTPKRVSQSHSPASPAKPSAVFNNDDLGFPQNEESVSACRSNMDIVLGGTNDYRGILDPVGNFTGWHFSNDGGDSLANEGLLPPVVISGTTVPSGGDPVDVVDANCNLYAGSLNYTDTSFPSGIAVYRTTPSTLASCPGGTDPSCWPTRRVVAIGNGENHFLDKEWMDVGTSGSAGQVVWVVYSDFTTTGPGPLDFTASIYAVRCNAMLTSCTQPILISGNDEDIQFGDVTIGPDGRTYITWSEIIGELQGTPQTFVHKLRIAPAGSATFGPTRIVHTEDNAIPFGGKLHANDFRIATYPKNAVTMRNNHARVWVVWDACSRRVGLGGSEKICEESQIRLKYSDDDGASWSGPTTISQEGDNYFPTISADLSGSRLAVAWYTTRHDETFHNRQDVELVTVNASSGRVTNHQFITDESNETEADPLLGGRFIGDYFEVFVHQRNVYVHYNANYRSVPFNDTGLPIPQQDNFLSKVHLQGN